MKPQINDILVESSAGQNLSTPFRAGAGSYNLRVVTQQGWLWDVTHRVRARVCQPGQSWALEVFFNFFNKKNDFLNVLSS